MIKNKNHWESFGTGRCEVGKKCFQYVNYKGKSILSFPTKIPWTTETKVKMLLQLSEYQR